MLGIGESLYENNNDNTVEPFMILIFQTFQLAKALGLLELKGIIHTDLKLENIMLVNDLRPLKVKIIDFGLASHVSQVEVGHNVGTRWYK